MARLTKKHSYPYVESGDYPRDYPAVSKNLAEKLDDLHAEHAQIYSGAKNLIDKDATRDRNRLGSKSLTKGLPVSDKQQTLYYGDQANLTSSVTLYDWVGEYQKAEDRSVTHRITGREKPGGDLIDYIATTTPNGDFKGWKESNSQLQKLSIKDNVVSLDRGGSVAIPYQSLSLSGSTLTLTNGGSVNLPSSGGTSTEIPVTRLRDESLDDMTATGFAVCNSSARATASRSYPEALAGALTVINNGSGFVFQQYQTYGSNPNVYYRYRSNGTWREWVKIAKSTDVDAVAATAKSAKSTADAAQKTADSAKSTASSAESTAKSAESKASSALSAVTRTELLKNKTGANGSRSLKQGLPARGLFKGDLAELGNGHLVELWTGERARIGTDDITQITGVITANLSTQTRTFTYHHSRKAWV